MKPATPLIALVFFLTGSLLNAQNEQEKQEKKPALTREQIIQGEVKTGPTPIPTPFDAFLALDKLNKGMDWSDVLARTVAADASRYEGMVPCSLMLGVKIADGLIAVKAQDQNALNDASKQIEVLAKKLGVTDAELVRAEKTRKMAADDDWLGVFMELSFLQTDILGKLGEDDNSDERALILAAGWVQGASLTAYAIDTHYSEEASGILRQPELVGELRTDLTNTQDAVKNHAAVKALIDRLPELQKLVDLPRHGTMPQTQVHSIYETAKELVDTIKNTRS